MYKLLSTLGLAALTLASAHAQGTINPLNGAITRIKFDSNCNGVYESTDRNATMADNIRVGIFWGAAGGPAETFAGEMTVGAYDGILVGLPSLFTIEGAGDVNTIISLQVRVLNEEYNVRTQVHQVRLAPYQGPGTVIWSSIGASGRFAPILIPCPEPSTLALGALAGALLLFRVRKTVPRR